MRGEDKRLGDDAEFEFIASKRGDEKMYSLVVTCGDSFSEQDFASCLECFAQDIRDGVFEFDIDERGDEHFAQ